MINKIDAHQIEDVFARLAPKQPNSAKAPADSGVDISLQVNYASLADKAMPAQGTDADAIRHAAELLRSDELESLENTRFAVENIVRFGV
jgi:hypothetical protein